MRSPLPGRGGASRLPGIAQWVLDTLGGFSSRFRNPRSLLVGIAIGVLCAFIIILVVDFFRVRSLASFEPKVPTKIFDKNGVLVAELFRQKREVVPLSKIPKNLAHAFVAIEDNEFYEHFGINPKGIARAFFINVFSGRIRQGGSTITQQLSKILLTSGERSIYRKVKEAFISIMMEIFYTKDEILTLYLNQIFLGHGAYGVQSASQFYFNKNVWELNLAECALLASLPSSPNNLSPIRFPERSLERHKIVLAKMVEAGYITIPQAEKAYLDFWPDYLYYINELPPTMNTWSSRIDKAPWFTEYVRRMLVKKYGEEKVYEEGLLVYTTMDLTKQLAAQKVLPPALKRQTAVSGSLAFRREDQITENYGPLIDVFSLLFNCNPFRRTGSLEVKKVNDALKERVIDELEIINYLTGGDALGETIQHYRVGYADDKDYQKVEGCLISIDHRTGYIEAMMGGSEFTSGNQLNRAMQSMRQPGSAVKPLLYAAAMESKKFSPATAVLDSPLVYLDTEGGDWVPENYEGEYYGLLRLRKALSLSINVISIRIADALGIEYVMRFYGKLLKLSPEDTRRRVPRNFSIALGSFEVSPFELARAYAIIANGGKDVIPFSVRSVKDRNGRVLENNEEEITALIRKREENGTIQVLQPATAQIMISLLQSVISSGTGSAASIGRAAAGKTGTTNNWKDAWFCGFSPSLTTCIWMGYDKLGLSLGIGQAGGAVVAPAWGDYMRDALRNDEGFGFPQYAALSEKQVCAISGLTLSSSCRNSISEVFIPGTEPDEECTMCRDGLHEMKVLQKGPRENISGNQKQSIMKNIKKKKGADRILDKVGNDLLN
ncbi:MAG: penicillin-binding protein 1A [Spirochaetota bacterium]|jgi:penicillin-binding protein 1A